MGSSFFRSMLAAALLAAAALPSGAVTLKKEAERKRAPEFELKDAGGNAVRLSDHSGRVVLLDFWATWCAPCKSAMPWLSELAAKYRGQGFEILGISMDEEGWEKIKPFLSKVPVTYPILLGTKRVGYLSGDVESLPLMFFVDRQQRVAAIQVGEVGRKEVEKTIRALLNLER
jgi:thiol-disulfide isomerase/thioredoxin